ncbi:hypothetical protein FKR81_20305 [Lentzea tibetensis]|uniref:V/A-type H+-transporting ATPase subunit F n=1 Tax=Lentzea tibetensis TaxID=2591470 RepID=A0A563ES67_9PSEU|nr:hypothetical protein [Lentzea tibetensis]TWP50516.1 hypothetical protein FKR81_20305 [Lentzea tibetensis]
MRSVLVVGREGAVVAAVVAATRARGAGAVGATTDEAACEAMSAGDVAVLVIGAGVERESRDLLRRAAESGGTTVVETPLRGGDVDEYVVREIMPRLRTGSSR